jgi:hypothetical protein
MFNNEHHVISNFKNKSFRTDLLQVLRKESNTKSIMKKQTEKNSYLLLNRCWALNFLVVKEWIQLLVGKKKKKLIGNLELRGMKPGPKSFHFISLVVCLSIMVQKKNGLEPDNIPLNWYFVRVFVFFVGEKYREIKGWNCDRSIEDCLILIWSCNMFFVVPSPYIREGREIVSPHLINQPFNCLFNH